MVAWHESKNRTEETIQRARGAKKTNPSTWSPLAPECYSWTLCGLECIKPHSEQRPRKEDQGYSPRPSKGAHAEIWAGC